MCIRFSRVLANSKVEVINTHRRTGGTYLRFRAPEFLIPKKWEFKRVWADVRADWMKVSSDEEGFLIVEVGLLVSEKNFRKKFLEAVHSAEMFKLHEKFKKFHLHRKSHSPSFRRRAYA